MIMKNQKFFLRCYILYEFQLDHSAREGTAANKATNISRTLGEGNVSHAIN